MRSKQPIRTKFWKRLTHLAIALATAIAFMFAPFSTSVLWGQTPQFPFLNWSQLDNLRSNNVNDEVDTGVVKLDGYRLFTIATPAITNKNSSTIAQRVQGIENTIARIANSNLDRDSLEGSTTRVDTSGSLPIIFIDDRYLMTVTTLDAQLYGTDTIRQANEFAAIARDALRRAKKERQPSFLVYQGVIAAGIFVAMIVFSGVLASWQRRYQKQKQQIEAETPEDPIVSLEVDNHPNPHTAQTVKQQLTKRQERNLSDLKRRLLLLGQVTVWVIGIFIILGLFPYTRWLQPFILSTPLKILGIILGTYILVRLGDLSIDRLFAVFQESEFLAPGASQRRALRISTLSRVLKSVTAILLVSSGILVSLSVVGVDLVPLLAGAGIIGLAISFAAQSVIKDTINGFLILLEDQYAVGDVIAIGNVQGLVENINLRITQLRDSEGKLITIPNSAISIVENLSKDWSRVDLTIRVAYGTDPDRALKVLRELAHAMYRDRYWRTQLVEPPEVLGIDAIEHSGMLIRIWIKTQPLQQWIVAREFRRRLKLAMKKEGIDIGTPQQFVGITNPFNLHDGHSEINSKDV
ncbi:MAG: mechanosensitive ion channel family protein [Hydrococcus sp. CRU_1_1]|nr:mechanosensitive ion channel family protein [Hydrococcus sp. CRU_1_1]